MAEVRQSIIAKFLRIEPRIDQDIEATDLDVNTELRRSRRGGLGRLASYCVREHVLYFKFVIRNCAKFSFLCTRKSTK